MSTLEERWESVEKSVEQACTAAGRAREEVRVIGVSKTVGLDAVAEAIKAGIHDFGENRPDELVRKHDAYPDERWHFIGNIQSRQLDKVVGRACLIHSLYQTRHADKIDRLAAEAGIVQNVLIEVNDGESNKQGVADDELVDMLAHCAALEHVHVEGLMIMAPIGDASVARATFKRLRELRDNAVEQLAQRGISLDLHELSMGMSNDYREGIGEGATMVRIGRAIFSADYAG